MIFREPLRNHSGIAPEVFCPEGKRKGIDKEEEPMAEVVNTGSLANAREAGAVDGWGNRN